VAGFGSQRAVELLVEAGFTPVEAIEIATANGAELLGEGERIGTLAPGKQADVVVVDGDPSTDIRLGPGERRPPLTVSTRWADSVFPQPEAGSPERLLRGPSRGSRRRRPGDASIQDLTPSPFAAAEDDPR
jgi:hypothetical protein